jgi:hypothetical protein
VSKKTFNKSHLDRFFSEPEENGTHKTQGTDRAQRTHDSSMPKYYRLNLKLKSEYKEYLERVSWEAHKSITQYLNDLIEADKTKKNI